MKRAAGLLLLVCAALFAQSSQLAQVFADVPAKARPKLNPLAKDPSAVLAGRKLFEDHCAVCHGSEGIGGKAPSLMSAEVQQASPGEIFWVITNGVIRKGMPAWAKLPPPQRWQIVAFLTSMNAPNTSAR
jgi:mono/diheme cytochrome c family protein